MLFDIACALWRVNAHSPPYQRSNKSRSFAHPLDGGRACDCMCVKCCHCPARRAEGERDRINNGKRLSNPSRLGSCGRRVHRRERWRPRGAATKAAPEKELGQKRLSAFGNRIPTANSKTKPISSVEHCRSPGRPGTQGLAHAQKEGRYTVASN